MNVMIRIVQVSLALIALNGVFGVVVQLGFSSLSDKSKLMLWNVIGSIVTALVLGCIIFLLQCYYEIRNKSQTSTSASRFMGVALTGASIAVFIGLLLVVLIAVIAISSL